MGTFGTLNTNNIKQEDISTRHHTIGHDVSVTMFNYPTHTSKGNLPNSITFLAANEALAIKRCFVNDKHISFIEHSAQQPYNYATYVAFHKKNGTGFIGINLRFLEDGLHLDSTNINARLRYPATDEKYKVGIDAITERLVRYANTTEFWKQHVPGKLFTFAKLSDGKWNCIFALPNQEQIKQIKEVKVFRLFDIEQANRMRDHLNNNA